jgi:uncharacterized iron-regulated protein
MRLRIAATSLLILAACASRPAMPDLSQADVPLLLLGEQHDEPAHHEAQRATVQALARRGVLAAVALEMADSGASTAGLPRHATEDDVRSALRWDATGWPWSDYAPAVMAAVAAGVPVVGANLPRERLRPAMQDASLDAVLPPAAIQAQQQAIRDGHCGLLPESRIAPMTRMQIARDRAIAATLAGLAAPGKTVLLIAGAGHVDPDVGVPVHLPPGLASRSVLLPRSPVPKRDYCEDMRRSLAPKPAS